MPGNWPIWRAQARSPRSMAPRWQTPPCAPAAGLVKRPAAIAKTPRVGSTRACATRSPRRGPGPLAPGPSPGARGRGRPDPAQPIVCHDEVRAVTEPTERLPRLAHARHAHVNAWRVPPVVEALQARRGAMHRGGHEGGRPGGPEPVRYPKSTAEVCGLAPCSGRLRGAAPAGCAAHSRDHPGPPGARGRRLGRSRARQGAPTPPTATRTTAHEHPGPPREGPGPAGHTRPTTRGPRPPGPRGHRRHRACAGGIPVGPGPGGTGHPVRLGRSRRARMPQQRAPRHGSHVPRERRRPGVVSPSAA